MAETGFLYSVAEQQRLTGVPAASGTFLAAVCLAVLAAAVLRGLTGFGFALVAVPAMSLFAPPGASLMVFFFATSIMALPALTLAGLVSKDTAVAAAAAFPCLLLGTAMGGRLFRRTTDLAYRRIAMAALLAVAASTAVRGSLELWSQRAPEQSAGVVQPS